MLKTVWMHLTHGPFWRYFLRSTLAQITRSRRSCPSCGADSFEPVARKMLVTALVRCQSCQLLYRIPTDVPGTTDSLYDDSYTADVYSDVPSDEKLQELIETKFIGSLRDYTKYIEVLKALGVSRGDRILDFGAAWGYGTWQFAEAGFEAVGFELGESRARYAREKLEVPVFDDWNDVNGKFDVFFSSHVVEHLPIPREAFERAAGLVRPGGLFVAFTPNGSVHFLRAESNAYHMTWGMYHPVNLDERFYQGALPDTPILLCSSPYDIHGIQTWDRRENMILHLTGSELLLAFVVN